MNLYIAAYEPNRPDYKSFQHVRIKVRDINDNPPTFPEPVYTASVREDSFPPVTVVRVTAVDADGPGNNQVGCIFIFEKFLDFFLPECHLIYLFI